MPKFTCVFVKQDKETILEGANARQLDADSPKSAAIAYKDIYKSIGPYVRVRDEDGEMQFFKVAAHDESFDCDVDEDNPTLKKLIYDLINKHGSTRSEKLDFLKQEGHGGCLITNKQITVAFESAVKESAVKTFRKNEKANRLAKERTDSIKKVTALLASRSILELELNDRHKIDNNLLSIAEKYKIHPLEKYEIEFLESYSNAKHLQIGNELLAMTSDNSGIKKAAGKVGVASTIAAVSSAIVHNQMAESISNIEENTEEIADSFDE
jgi:hypothetical protein